MYELLLLIGAVGFVAMAVLGFAHGGGGHGHGHAVGHAGHGHAPGHGHAHGGKLHLAKTAGSGRSNPASVLLSLLSPIDLFALCLGAGATGILLGGMLSGSPLALAAILGALAFDFAVIKPLLGLVMKFASKPSEGLEGTVTLNATAITKFGGDGKGLVQLTLDGQIVQLLGVLEPAEQELGDDVNKGDELRIVEVDPKHNVCVVSKLLRNP